MIRILICYMAVYSLGYDGSLLNGLQALPEWNEDMNQPKGYTLGLIAAAYYLPKIPGAPIIAICSDRFGRKPVLFAGAVFMIIGALLGGLATGYAMFVGSRVVLGVGTATSRERFGQTVVTKVR
jgi:MFS family permease